MSSVQCLIKSSALQKIFQQAVDSVRPKLLFTNANKFIRLEKKRNVLIIDVNNQKQEIDLNGKQCHLVGFGKAVLGMATQIEQLLGDRLVSGIISVPLGTFERFRDDPDMQLRNGSAIQALEGAADNLPDELAAENARQILEKCKAMNGNDVIIVLISGGGSALIALPIDPVTIEEKRNLIKKLASRQADINEINLVRTALSKTKGGKLAKAAAKAHHCLSLVLSDVCGDPLDVIASGPTFRRSSSSSLAIGPMEILHKYKIANELPESIKTVLKQINKQEMDDFPENSSIHLIGNNQMACESASETAKLQDMRPVIISTEVTGNVEELSQTYIQLIQLILDYRNEIIGLREWKDKLLILKLNWRNDKVGELLSDLIKDQQDSRPICLIAGGETTVDLKGSGIGGRNQELALRLSLLLHGNPELSKVMMLSAGTDGIDGPTTAAGAIGCSQVVVDSKALDLDAAAYLENNDSFQFYSELDNGRYHIITGHTGTNVMDLHIFLIPMLL